MASHAFSTTRRGLMRAAAGLGACAATGAAAQNDPSARWPDRPVRVIVTYPAGGSTDVLVRILSDELKKMFAQSFFVENRPGAGGNIGMSVLTHSEPDGYTICGATVGHFAINQFLYANLPYNPERDFTAASITYEMPNVFVVASDHVPAKSIAEFVTWAKPHGRISFGSPGIGTTPQLCGALFAKRAGLDAVHVPFRGAAQTIPAMLAGDVTYAIDNLASYVPTVESGRMRALAVTSAQRWPTLPNVPTLAEAGFPDFVVTSWGAFVVPAGTPRGVIDKLAAAQKKIAADPDVQKRFLVAGARVLYSTPEEAAAQGVRERSMWQEMVKISGATPQ